MVKKYQASTFLKFNSPFKPNKNVKENFSFHLFKKKQIIKSAVAMYVPALVLNQSTGVPIYTSTLVVCFVCIFYTCVGGLKAVVWTDVIQGFVMVSPIVVVAIKGTFEVGGITKIINLSIEGKRLEGPM